MMAWKVVELGSELIALHGIAFLYLFPENDVLGMMFSRFGNPLLNFGSI